MTTLAQNEPLNRDLGDIGEAPMIAADIIYESAAVGLVDATGLARPLAAGDGFVGFADDKYDNSAGAASAETVRYWRRGAVRLAVSGAVVTDVGQPVYASDDATFVFSPVGNSFVGVISRWVSSGVVIVAFDPQVMADPYPGVRETVSANKTLDAEDTGKTLFVDTDATTTTLPATATALNCKIVNLGAFGAVAVNLSPQAADKVHGPDIAGTDNKDLINTKATARRGDYAVLEFGHADGPVVTELKGTWAEEA